MNAAVLGGLVDQWIWRCQMVVTDYQLGRPIDFRGEVERLVEQAEKQARLLDADGLVLLVKVEDRLATSAHMAKRREPLRADPLLVGGIARLVTKTNRWRRIFLITRCSLTPAACVGVRRMMSSRRASRRAA